MRMRVVLPLFGCLAIALHPPMASGQYIQRSGGPGMPPVAQQTAAASRQVAGAAEQLADIAKESSHIGAAFSIVNS